MPILAICKMLAIPDDDYQTFRGWADDLVKLAEGVMPTREIVERAEKVGARLRRIRGKAVATDARTPARIC